VSATARVVEAPAALRTEVVRDAAGLLRLRAEWSALCSEARSGSLFLSPEWLVPWWEHFGEGREPSCIALFERERLVGFLPLFTEPVRIAGMPARRVAFLGDGATGCDYLDVLAAPGRDLPSARVLTAAELGGAFGRERIVHVAVAGGPLCRGLQIDLRRLAGLRADAAVEYGMDFAPAGPASQDGGTEAHD